jgi:halocyanin-like protein
MERSLSRRRLLHGVSLASVPALAGCVSSGDTPSAESGSPAATDSPTPTRTPTESPVDDLDAWLADANGYNGTPQNVGYDDLVEVLVGDTPDGEGLAFDPPVVTVTPGTTVVWRWLDHGGAHDVAALDDTFDSGDATDRPDETFSHHFDATGEYPYVCEPHRDDGMKGAIVVREPPESGYPALDHWLVDVDGWDGTLADRTDAESVSITVGAAGNGGHFAFDPLAVEISAGTTVSFEWTGDGGAHNVAFEDHAEASDINSEPGTHFEVTLDEPGVYRYACAPHQSIGQRGGIVVTE